MATYIAKKRLYTPEGIVEDGQEFELELPDGINPPPADVAVPMDPSKDVGPTPRKKKNEGTPVDPAPDSRNVI